ncbi:MAG TPA: histidine--tRNA ligase [Sedimentisphaerales bacterium]|nr:histidine--tRNA ligase [Sedimentisphaerales bacterium]
MKIPPVKGTRDFYPSDMARRNWIIDGWKKVSVRNGFEEYDGPIFEYLKMFQIKSGDEIVEQLFSFKDRGGRDLALRPEITPTLARMVNQQINSLPKPIKWFSVPRLFRAERPQKGRLREFFQWNIDIIGVDDGLGKCLADAEVIFTTLDYLREVGLTSKDIKVKVSSRELLAAYLTNLDIPEDKLESIYTVLDKKNKLPQETFEKILEEQILDKKTVSKILDFMTVSSIPDLEELVKDESDGSRAYLDIKNVLNNLDMMGVSDFCVYDPSIVRGLAYYTGIVFEVHDTGGELRAICGGGRYDNLLRDFGGPLISGTGMGMGDCVLEILLKKKGLLDKQVSKKQLEYFVAAIGVGALGKEVYRVIAELRSKRYSANFSYKRVGLSKQLKEASAQNAKKCIIIGAEELKQDKIKVKDMATGEQVDVNIDEFLSELRPK